VPVEETVRAMTELILRGDVLYWGTSEWPADLIVEGVRPRIGHALQAARGNVSKRT
jgi:aryl-alcohol dehydrogenase-like predicted oxidoreductase